MVGFGMIFDETYRPFFEAAASVPLYSLATGSYVAAAMVVLGFSLLGLHLTIPRELGAWL